MSDFQSKGWAELFDGLSDNVAPEQQEVYEEASPPDYDNDYSDSVDTSAQDAFDEQMSEAERRLHKATLYRQFVTGRVFEGADDPLTREVESEFRAFARHQLGVLLGVGGDASFGSQFTADEVKVLKQIADKVFQNARGRSAEPPKQRRQPPPPRPAEQPRPPSRPQLRPRPLPEGVRPQQERPPVQQKPKPPQKPQQSPQPTKPAPQQKLSRIPQDDEVVQLNGKTYKAKWLQMTPGEYGAAAEQQLSKLPQGKTTVLPNGIRIIRTEGDEFYKIIMRDLTTQVRPTNAVPMPVDPGQMAAITAMKSAEAAQSISASTNNLANLIINS